MRHARKHKHMARKVGTPVAVSLNQLRSAERVINYLLSLVEAEPVSIEKILHSKKKERGGG